MNIPEQTSPFAVYGFFNESGRCLYVGQTQSLADRAKYHRWYAPWYAEAATVRVLDTAQTRRGALARERKAIRELDPDFNTHGVYATGLRTVDIRRAQAKGELPEHPTPADLADWIDSLPDA